MNRRVAFGWALLVAASSLRAENWPGFRGPTGDGLTKEIGLPMKWSPTENVKWKLPLPDEGNSSPVVWGDRVFITQATKNGKVRSLWCVNRADGKVLWTKDVAFDGTEPTHKTNPYCAATPVTDGKLVVVSHGSAGLHCYDFDGKEKWKYELGKLEHIWGTAASPILYKNLCILWVGPGERQFLLGLDKETGAKVYQTDEPGGASGLGSSKDWKGSWSTPVVVTVGDHDEMILGVPYKLKGFDPAKGTELWSCDGLGPLVYTSAMVSVEHGIAVAMSGYGGAAIACPIGGKGDVTAKRLWRHTARNPQRIGSGVILGDKLCMLPEPGFGQCFDIKTGDELWKASARFGAGNWSSMLHSEGKLYVVCLDGSTLVIKPGDKPELLARNALGERTLASVSASDGQLFIRTYKHLWCIAGK